MMEKNSKIYVAGHRGMVGSAIVRELQRQGYTNIITRTHKELDLCRQEAVEAFFEADSFEDTIRNAISLGGDSDTIAAIAGGVAESYYGLDQDLADRAMEYLPEELAQIVRAWYNTDTLR